MSNEFDRAGNQAMEDPFAGVDFRRTRTFSAATAHAVQLILSWVVGAHDVARAGPALLGLVDAALARRPEAQPGTVHPAAPGPAASKAADLAMPSWER